MLGGCSSHNGAISFAPLAYDCKRWQDLGAENWTHAEMLRLVRKLRNNIIPVDERHRSQLVKDWLKTCSELFGVPHIDDFNREIEERGNLTTGCGFLSMAYTPENNHRSSASVAYISTPPFPRRATGPPTPPPPQTRELCSKEPLLQVSPQQPKLGMSTRLWQRLKRYCVPGLSILHV